MRTLLIILVLVNLLFFGWSHWVDKPVVGSGPIAGVPPLRLVAATAGPAVAAAKPAASAPRCASLGPLPDEVAASVIATALRARNYAPRERSVQSELTDGYWVYIDNLRDATARDDALKRLAKAGLRDAAPLVNSGQVSVGLFSAQAGANLRAAAVRAAGLVPVIEERKHSASEIWFDIDVSNDAPPPAVGTLTQGLNLAEPPAWGACATGNSVGTSATPVS
ncbi:MAG: hypothetical protein ACRES2_06270 [Steroidobacteraceae bacterium]